MNYEYTAGKGRRFSKSLLYDLPFAITLVSLTITALNTVRLLSRNSYLGIDVNVSLAFFIWIPCAIFFLLRRLSRDKRLQGFLHGVISLLFVIFFARFKFLETEILVVATCFAAFYSVANVLPYSGLDREIEIVKRKSSLVFMITLVMGAAFAMSFYSGTEYVYVLNIHAVFIVGCSIVYLHMERLDRQFSIIYKRVTIPNMVRRVTRVNNHLIAVFASVFLLLIGVVFLFSYPDLFGPDTEYFKISEVVPKAKPTAAIKGNYKQEVIFKNPKNNSLSYFFKWTETLRLNFNISALLPYLLGALIIVSFIYVIFKRYKREADRQVLNDVEGMLITNVEKDAGFEAKKARPSLLSINAQIRRLFFQKVKANSKLGLTVNNSSTSVTIKNDIERFEDITGLEQIYEIARYSEMKLSKDVLKEIKNKSKK